MKDIFDTEILIEDACQQYIGKHIGYSFWNLQIKDIKDGVCYISTMYNSQLYIGYSKKEDLKVMDELINLGITKFKFLHCGSIDFHINCHKWNPGKVEFICEKGINLILHQTNTELINISFNTFKRALSILKDNDYKINNLEFNRCSFDCFDLNTHFDIINLNFKNCDLEKAREIRMTLNQVLIRGQKHWSAAKRIENKKSKKEMGNLLKMGNLETFKGSIQIFNVQTNKAYNYRHATCDFIGTEPKFVIGNGYTAYPY